MTSVVGGVETAAFVDNRNRMIDPLARSATNGAGAFSSFREGLHQFKFFFAAFAAVIVSGHGNSPESAYPLAV